MRAGRVRVALSASHCAALAPWLAASEPPPPSLLADPEHNAERTARWRASRGALVALLRKAARRKAQPFETPPVREIPRGLAEWLGGVLETCCVLRFAPPRLALEALVAIHKTVERSKKGAGRPRKVRNRREILAKWKRYRDAIATCDYIGEDDGADSYPDLESYYRTEWKIARYQFVWRWWARNNTLLIGKDPLPTETLPKRLR